MLVHYGGKSAEKSGLLDRIFRSLREAGIEYESLGGVVPNPRLSLVYEGIKLCREKGIDFILAVGGGSTIDSSKAISYGLAEPEKDVWHAYVQQMEEEMGEPQELPGTYEKRPVLQAVQEGGYTFLLVGAEGEEQLYQWEKTWILLTEENQEEKLLPGELQNQLDLRQAQLEEKDRQIAYIREEYEKLRQIALKLQEDGRRMKEYIGIKRKKEYPPESGS